MLKNFQPHYGTGATLSASSSSASTALSNKSSSDDSICITNTGSTDAYIRITRASSTATAADMPIIAGNAILLGISDEDLYVSYVTASGTTTLHAIFGRGV